MNFLRFGPPGQEKPGLYDPRSDTMRDLSGHVEDLAGAALDPDRLAGLASIDAAELPVVPAGTRLGACVGNVGKLVGVGLNYADHAQESGQPVPDEPILFHKATSAICGPNDDVEIPPGALAVDWEVELAVVVGRRAKRVARADALAHVAGYAVINDVSERDWQLNGPGQWTKGKSHDTFAPLGPWLVPAATVPDPQALDLWLEVDGARRQTGNTRTMVFGVAELIHFISHRMTLQPGDVIATGTPPGVGLGMKPPTYLKPGQTMRLGIAGLGEQHQRLVAG